jgi:hypothetical protein
MGVFAGSARDYYQQLRQRGMNDDVKARLTEKLILPRSHPPRAATRAALQQLILRNFCKTSTIRAFHPGRVVPDVDRRR